MGCFDHQSYAIGRGLDSQGNKTLCKKYRTKYTFHISWCPPNFWTVASSGTGTHASFQAVPEPFDDPTSFVLIGVKRVTLSEVGFVFPPTLITHLKKTKMCQNWNVMFPSIFSTCQKQVRSFRWNSRSRNCQKQVWTMTPPKKRHFFQPSSPAFFPTKFPPQSLGWWPCIHRFWDGLWVCKEFATTWMSTPEQESYSPEVLTFSPMKNDGKGKRSGFFWVSTHFQGRTVKLQGCNSPFGVTDSVAWPLMLQA